MSTPDLAAAAQRILDPSTDTAEAGMLIMGNALPLARAFLEQKERIETREKEIVSLRKVFAEAYVTAWHAGNQLAAQSEALTAAEEALELSRKWLCNCIPTSDLSFAKPLPVIESTLSRIRALKEGKP